MTKYEYTEYFASGRYRFQGELDGIIYHDEKAYHLGEDWAVSLINPLPSLNKKDPLEEPSIRIWKKGDDEVFRLVRIVRLSDVDDEICIIKSNDGCQRS
jgi:hypothetical protein